MKKVGSSREPKIWKMPPFLAGNDCKLDEFKEALILGLQSYDTKRSKMCLHIPCKIPPEFAGIKELVHALNNSSEDLRLPYDFKSCKTCVPCFFVNYYNIACTSWTDRHFVGTNLLERSLMKCPSLSQFVFHRSNLWLWIIDDIGVAMNQYKAYPNNGTKTMYHLMETVIEHLPLFGSKHWKIIILKTNVMRHIVGFIEGEIRRQNDPESDYTEELSVISMFTVNSCYVFLLKWLEHYRKLIRSGSLSGIAVMNMKQLVILKLFIHQLDLSWTGDLRNLMGNIEYPWWRAEDLSYLQIIDKCTMTQWKKVQSAEQCQRSDCKKVRKDVKKWKKCSSCFVAVYCSRKCAKCDWKYGSHKRNCWVFSKLIRESKNDEEFINWMHDHDRIQFDNQ